MGPYGLVRACPFGHIFNFMYNVIKPNKAVRKKRRLVDFSIT